MFTKTYDIIPENLGKEQVVYVDRDKNKVIVSDSAHIPDVAPCSPTLKKRRLGDKHFNRWFWKPKYRFDAGVDKLDTRCFKGNGQGRLKKGIYGI